MKYPFLFLLVSVLLGTFFIVVLSAAALTEVKELVTKKTRLRDFSTD